MNKDTPIKGGIFLINKPYQWTSFNVVSKIKSLLRRKYQTRVRVGHAGTLDPLATGLLIVCTGKFTKQISTFQNQKKEYTGTFMIGSTTPSFDLETEVDQTFETGHITDTLIHETTKQFIGNIMQEPPAFSAVRIKGERAYKKARRGEDFKIQPKEISIDTFEITRVALPEVDFRIVCSKGTYIRSIARDFGKALNSGAHLTALCRTAIGEFRLDQAINIEALEQKIAESQLF